MGNTSGGGRRQNPADSHFNSHIAYVMLRKAGERPDAIEHRHGGRRNLLDLLLQGRAGVARTARQLGIPASQVPPGMVGLVLNLFGEESHNQRARQSTKGLLVWLVFNSGNVSQLPHPTAVLLDRIQVGMIYPIRTVFPPLRQPENVSRALYGNRALDRPRILEEVWPLFVLIFEAYDRTHLCPGQNQHLFLEIGKDLVSAHVSFKSVLVFRFVLLALGGNAPTVKVVHLSFTVISNFMPRIIPAFGTEDPIGDARMSNDFSIVADGGFPLIQQDDRIDVVGVFFLRLLGQAAEPVRRACAGD